jgi:hypothetical protein
MRFLLAAVVLAVGAEETHAFASINHPSNIPSIHITRHQRTLLQVASSEKEILNPVQVDSPTTNDVLVDSALKMVEELDEQDEPEFDEASFLAQTKSLCQQRNFPLQKVKNARDLASTTNSPIQPGRLYRMGRISDATDSDIQLLFQELGLKTLVDLRSPTELKDDATLLRKEVFGDFTDIMWMERGRGKEGCLKVLSPGQSPVKSKKRTTSTTNSKGGSIAGGPRSFWRRHFGKKQEEEEEEGEQVLLLDELETKEEGDDEVEDDDDEEVTLNFLPEEECGIDDCPEPTLASGKERHFVSLMNEFKYVRGTLSKVRKRDIARTLLKSPGALLSRRVRSSCKKPFIKEINDGGLPMLNELLLRFGAPGIKYVLELCADTNRHPVAFYCTAGKDRTGMIAAIIMGLCGVSAKDIVEDYTLSANVYAEMNDHSAMVGALSQRNLDAKTFLGAPPHVMRDTLEAINADYGSVEGYCNWIGFGPEKQEQLRKAVML